MIPSSKPDIGQEEIDAATRVLRSGRLVQGAEVEAFEREWEEKFGHKAVAVSSGTAALTLLLRAHSIGPGDQVILPSFSFFATAEAVVACGAEPVFADIDARSFCIDPKSVEDTLTARTKAIIAVHLFGHPARMTGLDRIATREGLLLLEDACQAHGAALDVERGIDIGGGPVGSASFQESVGALAGGGAFSFYPSKNMTTMEGGMVTTHEGEVASRVRLLRNHGLSGKSYEHELCSGNFKMTEVQAAIGRVQLRKLDASNARRRETADYYSSRLVKNRNVAEPHVEECVGLHAWNQYTVRVEPARRDLLQAALREQGIESRIYYPKGIHEQPMFLNMADPKDLPETLRATKEVLSLPVHPGVTNAEREQVMHALEALT